MKSSSVYLFLVANCVLQFATTLFSAQHFECENMPVKTTGILRGSAWALFDNGYVAQDIFFDADRTYYIRVMASSTYAGNDWAHAEILVDEIPRGFLVISSSSFAIFELGVTVSASAGKHQVAIAFVNDFFDGVFDRNLYLDWFEIDVVSSDSVSQLQVVKNPVGFSWLPNSENDLAGYRFYFGSNSRDYEYKIETGQNFYAATFDTGQNFYAAVSAVDTAGNESDFSEEVGFKVTELVPTFSDSIYVEWYSPLSYLDGTPMARDAVLSYDLFCRDDSFGVEIKLNAFAIKQTLVDPIFWADEVTLKDGRYTLYVEPLGKDGVGARSAPVSFVVGISVKMVPAAPFDIKIRVRRFSK